MKKGLTAGITHQQTFAVTPEMGVKHLGPGVSPVLSTPAMIGLMERTCIEFLTPFMDDSEQTVGFHVDVKHLAPTRIGQSVTVTVILREIEKNKFRFSVEAINDQGVKIGEGTHRRALINVKQFADNS